MNGLKAMIKPIQKARGASKRYGLYQAKAQGDSEAYDAIERAWFDRWNIERTGNVSPMAQFDESHKRWLESGREC